MAEMDVWDAAILAVAAYIGTLALVRLMRRRRDAVMAEFQAEVAEQLERKRAEQRRERNRAARTRQPSSTSPDTGQ